jgi:hypothetical protein
LVVSVHLFNLSVGSIQSEAGAVTDRFNGVTTLGDQLSDNLVVAANVTATLNTTDAAKTDLITGCNDVHAAVASLLSDHTTLPFNESKVDDVVDDFLQYLMYGGGGTAALVAVPALGILLGACARGAPLLQCSSYVYVLILLVVTVLSGLEYAGSVGLSDFCVDPDT